MPVITGSGSITVDPPITVVPLKDLKNYNYAMMEYTDEQLKERRIQIGMILKVIEKTFQVFDYVINRETGIPVRKKDRDIRILEATPENLQKWKAQGERDLQRQTDKEVQMVRDIKEWFTERSVEELYAWFKADSYLILTHKDVMRGIEKRLKQFECVSM